MESALYASSAQPGRTLGRSFHAFSEIQQLAEGSNEGDLHLFLGRRWVDESGEAIDLSGSAFAEMVRNFEASDSKTLSIDYDHRAWNPTHPDSKAAGWVKSLSVRDNSATGLKELWARVEWTARAAAEIRAGEWRFCSPAFVLSDSSSKTGNPVGARLLNVALTNVPFQDGLTPIKLSLALAGSEGTKTMAEDTTPATAAATDGADGTLSAFVDLVAEAAGVDRAAAVAALSDNVDKIGEMIRQTLNTDGMPAEEMSAAAANATAPVQTSAKPDELRLMRTEVAAVTAKFSRMSSELDALKAERDARAAAAAADKAKAIEAEADAIIADGRARDDQREDVVYMLSHAPDRAARVFAHKVVPLGVSQSGNESGATEQPAQSAANGELHDHEVGVRDALIKMGLSKSRATKRVLLMRPKLEAEAKRLGLIN